MTEFAHDGEAASDQALTDLLDEARLVVASACELDVDSVRNSTTLAERLQGVSQAVTHIIVARGWIAPMGFVSEVRPGLHVRSAFADSNVIRHFEDPETRTGRLFIAHPTSGIGAYMAVQNINDRGAQKTSHELRLPTDPQIDRLLAGEPCLWEEVHPFAQDFRSGSAEPFCPFDNRYYTEGAPQRYYGMFKELATELLAVSQ